MKKVLYTEEKKDENYEIYEQMKVKLATTTSSKISTFLIWTIGLKTSICQ